MTTPATLPPSGEQYEIRAGAYRAVVVEVGGGIRALTYDGRDLLDPFDVDDLPDGGRGQVLAPWPNRLRDGKWRWQGRDLQLPVSEVGKLNANHGLVRWAGWSPRLRQTDRVELTHRLHPQSGYPFRLDLVTAYAVDAESGLTVEVSAENAGDGPAPVALGVHPYVAPPAGGLVDDCTLTVPAERRVLVDDRAIPTGTEPVEGTDHDFRGGRRLGSLAVDSAFTGLLPDADGRVRVVLADPTGQATELWTDATAGWLQIYTGETLAPVRRRRGVAIEPMTAPANALASGEGLVELPPGGRLVLRWGVRAR